GRTAGRRVAVGLGDRLALDPDLLAADRHGDLLLLGHDVLAEPSPTGLAPLLPSPQLLLRTRHGVVRRRPGGVVADGAGWAGRLFVAGRAFLTVPGRAVRSAQPVVAVEGLLFLLGQVLLGVDPRRVL